jgi:integrase
MATHPIKNRRQILRIRKRLNNRDRMFFDLLINTGRRGCDIIKLRKKDIKKLQFETLYIKEQKTNKQITLPINNLKPLISTYTSNLNDDDFLFQSRKKNVTNHITTKGMLKRIKGVIVNENIQGTKGLHILRKTFVYWLIYWNHGDVELARRVMNHSSCKYTRYYAEWGQADINRAMKRFKGFLPYGKKRTKKEQ